MERAGTYLWVILSGVMLAITATVSGDGVKFPEQAYAKMPAIPSQQAMIVYRNGMETLLVESVFETESPSVGWVLPLPAEPSKLEVADSGMLRSLSVCLRPIVIHDLAPFPWWLQLFFVILVPVACVVIFSREETGPIRILVVVLLALFFWMYCFPVALGGIDGEASDISLKQFRRIGSYNVSVLRADNADALSKWLARNSLKTLSDEQKPVVEDYISRKWCFVVAKLRREGNHSARPHPISATFPTESPIYPMKLTALAGSTTRVDLFVVADMRAAADGFECIASDTFKITGPRPTYTMEDTEDQPQPYYSGRDTKLIVGSPDVGELMWKGCILTKLSADLAPRDMDRDIRIKLAGTESYQQRVYSALARRAMVTRVLLGGSLFVLIGLMIIYREQCFATVRQTCVILAIAVATIIAAEVTYRAIPVIPVTTGIDMNPYYDKSRVCDQLNAIGLLTSKVGVEAKMPDSGLVNLPQMMRECVPRGHYRYFTINNPITGKVMRYERSGGNFSARRVDGKLYICFYTIDGREYRTLSPFQGLLPEEKRDKE